MVLEGITKLQNGSDVRGIAMNGVVGEKITLDDNMVMKICFTFAKWLQEKTGKTQMKFAVGMDSRMTGPMLAQASCVGLICLGHLVYDCGLSTTPSMFMTCVDPMMDCDGAVMVTASHMPFNRNGLKLFTKEGCLNKEELAAILKEAETIETSLVLGGARAEGTYIPNYADNLVKLVREKTGKEKPLSGTKILVDAGNGAAGFFAELVLQPLGADTTGSQFLEPDGMFPNHIPNPEDAEAMASACAMVTDHQADMGIIFDTDGDRAAIIDEKGQPINRNAFIAFMSDIILEAYPGTTIVTDSVTSTGLTGFIEARGGQHHRFKRGYKNVINEAIRLNEAGEETHLAMETSGHGAVKENYFLDDGAYLVVLALIRFAQLHEAGKPLSSVLENFRQPKEAVEKRLKINVEDFKVCGEEMLEKFKVFAEKQEGWSLTEPNYEGVRVNCDARHGNGWALLRMSLHDPVMPLNIESDSEGGCEAIWNTIKAEIISEELSE